MNNQQEVYDKDEFDIFGASEKKKVQAKEQRLMATMIKYPRVSGYFEYMKEHFERPIKEIALATNQDKKLLMDKYLPIDILKMFNGLEIHNLNKAFAKFRNEIPLEAFIVIGFRILDIPKDESPYVLVGMVNLYHSLTTQKGKKTLNFRDFLNNFIRIQSMFSEHKSFVSDENKTIRFLPSQVQDFTHHDNPIKCAHYSKSLKLLFSLDEGSDHIRIYSANAELKSKILPFKKNHTSRSITTIMNFAWAESTKTLAVCLQDMTFSFFSHEEAFSKEEMYTTETLQTDVWYIGFCNYWFTTDTVYDLFYWDETRQQNKLHVRIGSKISNVSEISSLSLVAIASYDKKITFFNPSKGVVALTINTEDCSAHTLKYSPEQNMFFAATFGHVVKIYQVDKARDYSKVGKLESPATTSAIELLKD